jgi:hypothetical protein
MGKKGRLTVAEDARVQVLGSIAERDGHTPILFPLPWAMQTLDVFKHIELMHTLTGLNGTPRAAQAL